MPQGNFLMSGTITNAIVFLDESENDIDMNRVRTAAHIACANKTAEY